MAVNEIRYKGVSYATDDDIKVPSGILYEVKALRSDSLEPNSLTVTVFSNDKAIMGFAKNDKVEYFRDGRPGGRVLSPDGGAGSAATPIRSPLSPHWDGSSPCATWAVSTPARRWRR